MTSRHLLSSVSLAIQRTKPTIYPHYTTPTPVGVTYEDQDPTSCSQQSPYYEHLLEHTIYPKGTRTRRLDKTVLAFGFAVFRPEFGDPDCLQICARWKRCHRKSWRNIGDHCQLGTAKGSSSLIHVSAYNVLICICLYNITPHTDPSSHILYTRKQGNNYSSG